MFTVLAVMATIATADPIDQLDPPYIVNRPPPPIELAMSGKPPKCETVVEIDETGKPKAKLKCTF